MFAVSKLTILRRHAGRYVSSVSCMHVEPLHTLGEDMKQSLLLVVNLADLWILLYGLPMLPPTQDGSHTKQLCRNTQSLVGNKMYCKWAIMF